MDLVSIMNRGSEVVRENDAADHLRRSAEALVRAASAYEGFGLVAASPQAERVLGAANKLGLIKRKRLAASFPFDAADTACEVARRADPALRAGRIGPDPSSAMPVLVKLLLGR